MFTIFNTATRMPQERRFVTKGVYTLRKFVGLTVHMTVDVSMTMGLIYGCFMAISTRKVRFGLVLSNHNGVVAGFGQWHIQKNTDHILFPSLRAYSALCCFKYFFPTHNLSQWSNLNVVSQCTIEVWRPMLQLYLEKCEQTGHCFVTNALVMFVAKLLLPESSVVV